MKIKLSCVQSTDLNLCFTHFSSAESIIECVVTILKAGQGLPSERRTLACIELLFHEEFLGISIPRSYHFFYDMKIEDVVDYLKVELINLTIE